MKKTRLGCTILEGNDVANLPLVSQNSEILDKEIEKVESNVGGYVENINKLIKAAATQADLDKYKNENKDMLENTKGTISARYDTGEVYTRHISQINVSEKSTANGAYSQVNASQKSTASGAHSQVNASFASTASGEESQVNTSYNSTASGKRGQVNASYGSTASGERSQVNTSFNCVASGKGSQVNASKNSTAEGQNWAHYGGNVVISGKSVKVDDSCGYGVVAGGYSTSDIASTQNRKWQFDAEGTIKASGAITGNSSFADFAEYFESENGKSIPLGTIVSLAKGGKIKVSNQGDYMVGVISQTAGVILNAQGFEWKDRYLYDRYGQPILVEKEIENKETGGIEIVEAPMLNKNWDEDEEYIAREDREEWNVVGLTGQIFVNVDDTVQEGDFIKVGENGIGTKGRNEYGQNWQVMKITTKYEEKIGFGIAMVFVR